MYAPANTHIHIVHVPFWVNLRSALSGLNNNRCSARLDVNMSNKSGSNTMYHSSVVYMWYLVNILYGSETPLVVRSSIRTPIYAVARSKTNGSAPLQDWTALMPATSPCVKHKSSLHYFYTLMHVYMYILKQQK